HDLPFVPRNDDCHICFSDIGVICDMSYTAVSPNNPLETDMNASDVIPDAKAQFRVLIGMIMDPLVSSHCNKFSLSDCDQTYNCWE
ncbi:hypothetical protein M405DRAFT_806490, partial [Rhizopogon salebrosus TDB-379]